MVEAAMILPLIILAAAAVMWMLVHMYVDLAAQCAAHLQSRWDFFAELDGTEKVRWGCLAAKGVQRLSF